MQPQLCVVTGVAGFVASHLAERLLADGHAVVGVDCFTDFYPRPLKEANLESLRRHSGFRLIEADLLELDLAALLREAAPRRNGAEQAGFEPVDYVFHLAAQAGVRDSWGDNFDVYLRNNVRATQRLLEAAKASPLKKLVYASSSSVYGDAEAYPTDEDVVPRPVSPYGVTKLAGEQLALLYWRNYGVPAVALRFFTVYGPRQRPDMAFHRFIRAILEGTEIPVYGDGEQTRDFTYVADTVDGIVRAAYSDVAGAVFNLGGGSRVSVNAVIRLLEGIVDRPARVRHLAPGRGDVRHTSADIRRAAHALGYVPRTTTAEGLRAEAEWLRDRRLARR